MTFHEYFANFSPWFWAQVANHLWQSTLFVLPVIAGIVLLRNSSAKARYAVWLTASAKFVLPLAAFAALGMWAGIGKLFPVSPPTVEPSVSNNINFVNIVSLDVANSGSATAVSPIESIAANAHHEMYCLLTLAWAIGCALLFALWCKRSREFKRLLKGKTVAPPDSRETELLRNAQIRMGLYFPVALIVSDFIREPTLTGIWKPTVIIPRGLSENLSDDEYELILMHELAHAARRDNLVGVLQMALCCLLWFHPLVWFIKRKLLEERERACDEAVVRHEGEPRDYISGLLKVVRFGLHSEQSAGLANTTGGANLKKRLELIMNDKIKNTNSKRQRWIVGSTIMVLVLICVVAGFSTSRADSASSSESFADSTGDKETATKFRQVEIYFDGKLINTMDLGSPKPNLTMFSYLTYIIPEGQNAQTGDGQKIYGLQIIPTPQEDSVKVEVVAVLEDLSTSTNSHPLYEFKKQTVASYDLRAGESAVVSEMAPLGLITLDIKVAEYATEKESPKIANRLEKSVYIHKSEQLPDISFKIVGNDDCPMKITEAVGSQITNALYTKLTGQTTSVTGADGKTVFPNVYGVPIVKTINNSGKTIIGLIVAVTDPKPRGSGKWRGVIQGKPSAPQAISIAPGQSYTVNFRENHQLFSEKYWLAGFTDPANFYVTVSQVQFDDGTSWTAKESK